MGKEDTWLHHLNLNESEWHAKYIESFSWSCYTLMLIGAKGYNSTE